MATLNIFLETPQVGVRGGAVRCVGRGGFHEGSNRVGREK